MNTHSKYQQQTSKGAQRKNLQVSVIACLIINVFCALCPSRLSATAPKPQLQVSVFLENQLSEVAEQLLKDFPNNAYLIKLTVIFHRQCNRPGEAMMLLEQGLKHNPGDYNLNNLMALIAFNNGYYEKSIGYWEQALEISPKKFELHNNIADALISLGEYSKAIERLKKRIGISASSARSYHLLGQGYMQLKEYAKAKECYEKALSINPDYPQGNYWLGKAYIRLKQPDKAKQHMDKYRKQKDAKLSQLHDSTERRVGNTVHETLEAELDVFPGVLSQLCVRGSVLYQSKGDAEKAYALFSKGEQVFQEALSVDSNQPDIYREFASLYIETNHKPDEAIKLAEKAVALKESAKNYFILGHAYHVNSDLTKTLSAMKKAVKLDPKNVRYRQIYNKIKRKSTKW